MLKQFAQKVEDLRRLIDNQRSASSVILSHSLQRLRRLPSEPGKSRNIFLLAVSGGMDSMCMADLFLKTVGADAFAIAHCNFSLRGEESDGDEMLVSEWAEKNAVKCFVKRFDTAGYAQANGISIEMAARDLRYAWFSELCAEHGYDVLSVAHNANDNAETLMLNLLRGTGLNGLHGMSEIQYRTDCALHWPLPPTSVWRNANSDHQSVPMEMVVIRPLLEYTRKQIEGYVLVHRVPYRHDSSNFESDYKRNKIRNDVFPVFEKINPSFVRTLNREIGYFTEAGSIVEDWCRMHMTDVLAEDSASGVSGQLSIDITRLLATQHWRYLLYYILSPYGFNQQNLASIESLLTSSRTISGKRFDSPTHTLLTGRGVLSLVPSGGLSGIASREDVSASSKEGANGSHCLSDVVIRGIGTYNFNGIRFTVELLPWDNTISLKQPEGTLIFDADKLHFPFLCRKWRQGDWLNPLGLRGKKKVSDLFADLKYDTFAKDAAVIVVDTQTDGLAEQQHIASLLGVRIDNRYKVTADTETIIRISIR